MTADLGPEGGGGRKGPADPVEDFTRRYPALLSVAESARETTLTDAWTNLYKFERKKDADGRAELAATLIQHAEQIRDHGSDEEIEKAIGKCKAMALELRERKAHFEATTVQPIKDPVEACMKLIADAQQEARELADNLHHVGIQQRMKNAIDAVAKPRFDEEDGRINIIKVGRAGRN